MVTGFGTVEPFKGEARATTGPNTFTERAVELDWPVYLSIPAAITYFF
jgi:hypothetical protein